MIPSTCPAKQISGGQREEGHGVVHHVQGEHHQTYLWHHYQNASMWTRTWWNNLTLILRLVYL